MRNSGRFQGTFLNAAILIVLVFLFGTPAHAGVNASPTSVNFGNQTVGTASAPAQVTVTFSSQRKWGIQIVSVSLSPVQFSYSGPALPITLHRGQSATFSVTFAPTAAQAYAGTLVFTLGNGSTIAVPLSGTGIQAAAQTQPPTITTQPVSQSVTAGQAATFSVGATGTAPMAYQWKKNGTMVTGATSSIYITPPTTTSDNGAQFTVDATDSAGSATSAAATLTVNATAVAPSITTQPVSKTVPAGQTATFTVAATGTAPMAYQWNKNGTAISGATSSTYTTPATTTSDNAAQFTVGVSNSAGIVTSAAATLTVTAYTLNATPVSFSLSTQTGGAASTQSVSINDTTPAALPFTLSVDQPWITLSATSGTTQPGGTPMKFTVNPSALAAGNYTGHIFVTASGVINSPLAVPITLAVSSSTAVAPTITTQPASKTVTAGQTATFTVAATGTSPMTYQWNKNGTPISGATSSTYTTPATTTSDTAAQFTVGVSNSAGSATSSPATLTVNAATALLNASSTSLSFGSVTLSTTSSQNVTLTNAGNSNVTISGVSVSGAGFNASGVSTGLILTPGQTATLSATFTPAATGSVTGSVTVTSSASNSPDAIALSGAGVAQINHSVALSWSPSTSTVVGYNSYSSTVSGGPYAKLTSTPVSTTTYTDSTVQAGLTYYYVVTAVDSSNMESAFSTEISATVP